MEFDQAIKLACMVSWVRQLLSIFLRPKPVLSIRTDGQGKVISLEKSTNFSPNLGHWIKIISNPLLVQSVTLLKFYWNSWEIGIKTLEKRHVCLDILLRISFLITDFLNWCQTTRLLLFDIVCCLIGNNLLKEDWGRSFKGPGKINQKKVSFIYI